MKDPRGSLTGQRVQRNGQASGSARALPQLLRWKETREGTQHWPRACIYTHVHVHLNKNVCTRTRTHGHTHACAHTTPSPERQTNFVRQTSSRAIAPIGYAGFRGCHSEHAEALPGVQRTLATWCAPLWMGLSDLPPGLSRNYTTWVSYSLWISQCCEGFWRSLTEIEKNFLFNRPRAKNFSPWNVYWKHW